MSSLTAIRTESKARDLEEKKNQERKRNVLVLIARYLQDQGYFDSTERLQDESNVSLQRLDAADNVDLLNIVQEYEEHYDMKFGKKPKLVRKLGGEIESAAIQAALPGLKANSKTRGVRPVASAGSGGSRAASDDENSSHNAEKAARARRMAGVPGAAMKSSALSAVQRRLGARDGSSGMLPPPAPSSTGDSGRPSSGKGKSKPSSGDNGSDVGAKEDGLSLDGGGLGLDIGGTKVEPSKRSDKNPKPGGSGEGGEDPDDFFERRVLKPLPDFGCSETRELAATIQRDIYLENPNVRWGHVAGLDTAKKLLKEAVVMPHKYPQFFHGLLTPWKGILLYGPPGTGKTMLARAVATECKTTFFNISASTIVSKWRGDSEKLVRVLFDLARYHAPSTIFMDEIDALMSSRDGAGEHEASRRMKTELLVQMDGLAKTDDLVFVLAATNLPWELDMAMLRRLEKRILVPLPNEVAREAMHRSLLAPHCLDEGIGFKELAQQTEGYSGSDVMLLCKEMAMRPLRRLLAQVEDDAGQPNPHAVMEIGPITAADVQLAQASSKPSARLLAEKYEKWSAEYGEDGASR
ncbi:hypothetical protein CYMTET_44210 [Cymbomonas tetramitiformis]|uniref:Katanin p60 ATPase-containing subunit A-like 2 n=1 Tax=Cymbomonas tetramitiformis TaxID=36881 RepID=A0AAE0C2R6_9CHLO|nr:hypothetical protein CYMTET_44210 [Cymbomonas tetramitiformis]